MLFRNIDFGELLQPEMRAKHKYTTYDLMANIVHDGEPEAGKGTYRAHILHKVHNKDQLTQYKPRTCDKEYPDKCIALDKMLFFCCCFFFNPKVLIIFLLLQENKCCGYSLEVPHQGTSNEYPQHMFS